MLPVQTELLQQNEMLLSQLHEKEAALNELHAVHNQMVQQSLYTTSETDAASAVASKALADATQEITKALSARDDAIAALQVR